MHGQRRIEFLVGDCLPLMQAMPTGSVDIVLGSPPYEDQRTYGKLGFSLRGQEWVDWALPRFVECCRISRGLVAWVVEGKTEDFEYSATPALLLADLKRLRTCSACGKNFAGDGEFSFCCIAPVVKPFRLRKPPIFRRNGIFGGGGQQWWRNDYEFVICATSAPDGKLPYAVPNAIGHPPKYAPGGAPSHRTKTGERVKGEYKPPALCNPGNVAEPRYTVDEVYQLLVEHGVAVDVAAAYWKKYNVGGGHMGHPLAHKNEAPFPVELATDYLKCFCPPGGRVLDPFVGSGTTMQAALELGMTATGIDLRPDQIKITRERLASYA